MVDTRFEENIADNSDEEIEIEIIEVEEPEEPVPTQDSCLQVRRCFEFDQQCSKAFQGRLTIHFRLLKKISRCVWANWRTLFQKWTKRNTL